jgi:hypothetical protein
MNSRERFLETMRYGKPDRPPLFEEGIREGVLQNWKTQGMPVEKSLSDLFYYDHREEISFDLLPRLDFSKLAQRKNGLDYLAHKLDSQTSKRMPENWRKKLPVWQKRNHTLMLMVHWGLFESIGIEDGRTFIESVYLMVDKPDFIRGALAVLGEFSAKLTETLLAHTSIDAAIFSEPIGGNHGALVSPEMYSSFALASYRPIMDVLKRHNVQTIIWRTYANTRALLGAAVQAGMNCLWACESNPQAMDYLDIREEYGPELRLIGGIDVDLLYHQSDKIRCELERMLPPLLARGGYCPLADGRVRRYIPYKGYVTYRKLLEQIVTTG